MDDKTGAERERERGQDETGNLISSYQRPAAAAAAVYINVKFMLTITVKIANCTEILYIIAVERR